MPSPGVGVGVRVCLARRLWAVALGSHRRTVLRKGVGAAGWRKGPGTEIAFVCEAVAAGVQQGGRGQSRQEGGVAAGDNGGGGRGGGDG